MPPAAWLPWHLPTVPIKAAISLQCVAWSFQIPYVPVNAKAFGATMSQIGWLGAAPVLIQMVLVPPLTQIAEQRGLLTEATAVVWVVATVGTMLLAWADNFTTTLIAFVIWAMGSMAVIPLNDSSAMTLLEKMGAKEDYGKHRLWGAVAWGLGNAVSGWLIGSAGFAASSRVSTFLTIMAAVAAVWLRSRSGGARSIDDSDGGGGDDSGALDTEELLPPALDAAAQSPVTGPAPASSEPKTEFQQLCTVFLAEKPFLCVVFLCGGYMAIIQLYLFLWLAELGGSTEIMGLSLMFSCISEPFFFFFAPRMIKTLGVDMMLQITMATYAVRCVGYTLLVPGQAVWVLPIELLHGISFGVFSSAAVHRASELAPVGMEARAQGFTTGVRAAGQFVGVLAAAIIYQRFGARVLWWSMAALMAAAFLGYRYRYRYMPSVRGPGDRRHDCTP